MSSLPAASSNEAKLQSLLIKFQKHNEHGRTLLLRLTELAPHMLAPREWTKLQIPQKLIDIQAQFEYAICHERTNREHLTATKKEIQGAWKRYEESKKNPPALNSQLETPESERPDSQISDLSQYVNSEPVDSQLSE